MTESSASASSDSETQARGRARDGVRALGEGELHLWLCRRDAAVSSDAFKRGVLSRYASVAPADWQFAADEHGKPRVVGAAAGLQFNVSHSREWLVCALARHAPVGVDLEYCDTQREVMKLAQRFFCAAEVSALAACAASVLHDRFYDLWTLKEAAVKARGEALAPGLQHRCFAITYPGETDCGPGSIAASTPAAPEPAHYCLLDALPDYRLAVCSLAPSVLPMTLRLYELHSGDAVREHRITQRASSWQD